MLLQHDPKLEDLIVIMLAKKPGLSAEQIRANLTGQNVNYTLQAVYKELSRLIRADVVTKIKSKYLLRLSWVINLASVAQDTIDRYSTEPNGEFLPPMPPVKPNKFVWEFKDLYSLDNLCGHIILLLAKNSRKKEVYLWSKYPWHPLMNKHNRPFFLKAWKSLGCELRIVLGRRSPLGDFIVSKFPSEYSVKYLEETDNFFLQENSNKLLVMAPPYVMCIDYPDKIGNRINELFEDTPLDLPIIARQVQYSFSVKSKIKVITEVMCKRLQGKLDFLIAKSQSIPRRQK
jgi:hypothetical protein